MGLTILNDNLLRFPIYFCSTPWFGAITYCGVTHFTAAAGVAPLPVPPVFLCNIKSRKGNDQNRNDCVHVYLLINPD